MEHNSNVLPTHRVAVGEPLGGCGRHAEQTPQPERR
jgi:hypothetical protein